MKRHMSERASLSLLLSVLALALVLGGSVARADDLNLGSNYVPVSVDENGVGATNVGGGPITVSYLNGTQLAWVYCIGFYTDVPVPDDYADTTVRSDGVVNGVAVENAGEIAWLLDDFAGAAAGNSTAEQALQATIWSVEYNGQGTSAGYNTITGDSSQGYWATYESDLAALGSNTAALNTVDWFTPSNGSATEYQGLVGPNIGSVPEPMSILLLGTVLLCVPKLRRKFAAGRQR
jgi:hypothetical protein